MQANRGICGLLSKMSQVVSDPMLRASLDEQIEVKRRLLDTLYDCNDSLRRDPRPVRDLALEGLLQQGEAALTIDDPMVRDLVIATSDLRFLYWTLAGCASLASLWRQLDQPHLGVELEHSVYQLTGAREQLEWMLETLLRRGGDRATPEIVQRHQIPVPHRA